MYDQVVSKCTGCLSNIKILAACMFAQVWLDNLANWNACFAGQINSEVPKYIIKHTYTTF